VSKGVVGREPREEIGDQGGTLKFQSLS